MVLFLPECCGGETAPSVLIALFGEEQIGSVPPRVLWGWGGETASSVLITLFGEEQIGSVQGHILITRDRKVQKIPSLGYFYGKFSLE